MNIFFTNSTKHFANKINLPQSPYIVKKFSDGEIYIKVDQDVQKKVWVIASTQPPADNLLELFFLLDALERSGAQKINILISYFAYARQAVALTGEAGSAQFIATTLTKFPLAKIYIVHAHAAHILEGFLPFTNMIPIDFFCSVAKNYDVIAAPDKGAFDFAQTVAQQCKKEIVFFYKKRPEHEKVIIESINGNVNGKRVLLVDDIISTGRTIIQASKAIIDLGAQEVSAAATHGIFAADAHEKIDESQLKKVYVTNTLEQMSRDKIEVHDVSKFIESIIIK
jgi:ribose-phosphate pyrophosphokinase